MYKISEELKEEQDNYLRQLNICAGLPAHMKYNKERLDNPTIVSMEVKQKMNIICTQFQIKMSHDFPEWDNAYNWALGVFHSYYF